MKIVRNQREYYAGLMFVLFGAFIGYVASDYAIGTSSQMGPGYWPRAISFLIGGLGTVLILKSFTGERIAVEMPKFGVLFWLFAAVLSFPFALYWAGFPVAVALVVLLSSFAEREFEWRPTLSLMIGLSMFASFLFVVLLGLNFNLMPEWMRP